MRDGTLSKNASNVAETSHQNQEEVLALSTLTRVSEEKRSRIYTVLSSLTVLGRVKHCVLTADISGIAWPVKFAKHLWDISS